MRRDLPSRAHLDHLKKQAKVLLRAARNGEPEAADRLRAHLTRLSSPAHPAASDVTLQEAQFVVAREYGFESWAGLIHSCDLVPQDAARTLQLVREIHERLVPRVMALFSRPGPAG